MHFQTCDMPWSPWSCTDGLFLASPAQTGVCVCVCVCMYARACVSACLWVSATRSLAWVTLRKRSFCFKCGSYDGDSQGGAGVSQPGISIMQRLCTCCSEFLISCFSVGRIRVNQSHAQLPPLPFTVKHKLQKSLSAASQATFVLKSVSSDGVVNSGGTGVCICYFSCMLVLCIRAKQDVRGCQIASDLMVSLSTDSVVNVLNKPVWPYQRWWGGKHIKAVWL